MAQQPKPITFSQNEKDQLTVGLSLALARSERLADDKRNPANVRDLHQKNVDDTKQLLQRIDREA